MKIASLFSGVGGLELGLEAAGLGETVAQVECDPYCQRVLARHWPSARRFQDVRQVSAADLDGAQLYCGGFPCQDVSRLGGGRGLDGERSGLWREYARLVGEGRPEWVVVENVAALVKRGLAAVLGDLAALGYDAWWDCVPAAAVGASHLRDRLFVVARLAHAHRDLLGEQRRGVSARALGRQEDTKGKLSADRGRGRASAPRRADKPGVVRCFDGLSYRLDLLVNATKKDDRASEVLRQLQAATSQKGARKGIRRLEAILGTKVLQSCLCREGEYPGASSGAESSEAAAKATKAKLRNLRYDKQAAITPQRPRSEEHQSDQPDDAMYFMPCEMALDTRIRSAPSLSKTFPTRPYEEQLAREPPRSAEPGALFRQRHRAIGNAVVPQVAYVIGCAIRKIIENE